MPCENCKQPMPVEIIESKVAVGNGSSTESFAAKNCADCRKEFLETLRVIDSRPSSPCHTARFVDDRGVECEVRYYVSRDGGERVFVEVGTGKELLREPISPDDFFALQENSLLHDVQFKPIDESCLEGLHGARRSGFPEVKYRTVRSPAGESRRADLEEEKHMSDQIKTVTECVTCGQPCDIGGADTRTHFYIPKSGPAKIGEGKCLTCGGKLSSGFHPSLAECQICGLFITLPKDSICPGCGSEKRWRT